MFSSRLPRDFEPNRFSEAVQYRRRQGVPLLDLTVTNPTRVGLPRLDPAAWTNAGAASDYDPDPRGLAAAREAVAAYYAGRGTPVDPGRIVLTASTSEAYAFLFKLLADPGGEFLAPAPSYPLFDPLASLEAVTLRSYPIRFHDRWWLDREALEIAVSPKTRGIILVEPNNPTGSILDRSETAALADIARNAGVPVIADQVFGDFMANDTPHPAFFSRADGILSFTLSGLSKVCGLPQVKAGWIVLSGPEPSVRKALAGLEWIADTYLSVSTPVQAALPCLLAGRETFQAAVHERLRENERTIEAILRETGAVVRLPRDGGWSFLLRVPRVRSEEEWCLALLDRSVILHPGHFYDFTDEAWLVGSLITEPDVLREGMTRLVEMAKEDGFSG